ncbi:DNA-binding WRKY, partial [Cynara cardunculus var. scolymus]
RRQAKVIKRIAIEEPLDDGYVWRKYGEKKILNSKYPRQYYRCNSKILHNCYATKQVERSTKDPSFFIVAYSGNHTCPRILSTNCSSTATELAARTVRTRDSSPATESASTINDSSFQNPTRLQSLDLKKKNTRNAECTTQVKIILKTGFDKPPDDGYAWSKYGIKRIKGADFRAYYKCRHCNVKKRVERSFDDQCIVEITYKGVHTCLRLPITSHSTTATKSASGILENSDTTSIAAESASSILTIAQSASIVTENSFGQDSIKKISGSASIQKWEQVESDIQSSFSPPFILESSSSCVTSKANMITSEVVGNSSRNLPSSANTPEDAKEFPLPAFMASKEMGDKITKFHQLVCPSGKV